MLGDHRLQMQAERVGIQPQARAVCGPPLRGEQRRLWLIHPIVVLPAGAVDPPLQQRTASVDQRDEPFLLLAAPPLAPQKDLSELAELPVDVVDVGQAQLRDPGTIRLASLIAV